MAITTTMTNQCKQDLFDGVHATGDVYKLVLIKPGHAGTWDASKVTYAGAGSEADEVATGGGYTQGGITLAGRTSGVSAGVGYMDWSDVSIGSATISAVGAIIVNTSKSNKILSCHDFGGTVTSSNSTFAVTIPSSGTGCLRIT